MSLRTLKKLAAAILPEAVKGPLRDRLFGFGRTRVSFGLWVEEEAGGVAVAHAGGLVLRLPSGSLEDAEFHFRGNAASVEEMYGFLRQARGEGGLLFDVGAHRGLFAHVFCLARAGNRAVGFEPSPPLRAAGEEMARLNRLEGRLRYRPAAVSAAPGSLAAWTAPGGFIQLGGDPPAGTQGFEVEVTTLDAECARMGEDPDVVKVDVEGHELEVLRGARELLARRKPVLFLELHPDLLERGGSGPAEVAGFLRGFGYRFESSLGAPLRPGAVARTPMVVLRVVAR
ncbi:MAG TPA: FkbM family methyltransferase [Longimicrobium sp.]|nr:FkbM family methyltransferase [Longimicrobium sp.]